MKEIRKKLTERTRKAIKAYKTNMELNSGYELSCIVAEAQVYIKALVDMEVISIPEACGLCGYLKISVPRLK